MMADEPTQYRAWNQFVLHSEPAIHADGSLRRAAAMAKIFLNLTSNGGFNSFLTTTFEHDAEKFILALRMIGADLAARHLSELIDKLGGSLHAGTETERWETLDRRWIAALDAEDQLSPAAEAELMAVLELHVAEDVAFYEAMGADE